MNAYFKIGVALGALVALSGGSFYAGYKAAVRYHTSLEIQAQNEALLKERQMNNEYATALNEARQRQTAILADFDNLALELNRLRDTAKNSLPANTEPACLNAVDTRNELFTDCAAKYADMARKADQHAEDVRALNSAWQALQKGN